MRIRPKQWDAFETYGRAAFEDAALAHLERYFPRQCRRLKNEGMRILIRERWKTAGSHNIVSQRGVLQYLDMSLYLGASFATDPRVPWAGQMLGEDGPEIPKMEALFQESHRFLDAVMRDLPAEGGDTSRLAHGIKDILRRPPEPILPADFDRFRAALTRDFYYYFPAKASFIGDANLTALIDAGLDAGAAWGIGSERGLTIYVMLMFLIGSGFATDIQYPWAAEVLTAPEPNRDLAAERLGETAVSELRQWMA